MNDAPACPTTMFLYAFPTMSFSSSVVPLVAFEPGVGEIETITLLRDRKQLIVIGNVSSSS